MEKEKGNEKQKIMDLSGEVHEIETNYKDIIFAGILGFYKDPGELVDELDNYRKIN